MQFTLCENTGFYLRMGLVGPSGSGKTFTALKLATELGYDRIGIIDTENRSARRYAKAFAKRFYALELEHFSPRDYIEAIRTAEAAGLEVLVIDSLSHAWMGRGGVLEMVDLSARRQTRGGPPSSFSGWREVTPEHNRLVEALVHAKLHLVVTMRVKTEYVVEKDQSGKSVPRKVGLAPVQREGLEYEFDIVGDLSPEHDLCITKSRCPALTDLVVNRPGAPLAATLRAWLDGAERIPQVAKEEPEAEGEEAVESEAAPAMPSPPAPLPEEEGSRTSIHELPQVRAVAPRPRTPGGTVDEISAITPWLKRIQQAEEQGSEEELDAVRTEMNATLRKRTRVQGETLRRAIETARAAIRAAALKQAQLDLKPSEQAIR